MTDISDYINEEFKHLHKESVLHKYKSQILAIAKTFAKQGHSGASAACESSLLGTALSRLLMFEPIAPIFLDKDEDWIDVSDMYEKSYFQHKRQSSLFKDGVSGQVHNIDAVVYRDTVVNGKPVAPYSTYTNGTFTFVPKSNNFQPHKSFILEVISKRYTDKDETQLDDNGGWWQHLYLCNSDYNRRTLAKIQEIYWVYKGDTLITDFCQFKFHTSNDDKN